jgi:hypothetical protein
MMWNVVAAGVSGLLTLFGVWLTVRASRRSSTSQHIEQTAHLVAIQDRQNVMLDTIQLHRDMAEQGFSQINSRVDSLCQSQDTLFNMVVEVDAKVTKPAKKKIPVETEVVDG